MSAMLSVELVEGHVVYSILTGCHHTIKYGGGRSQQATGSEEDSGYRGAQNLDHLFHDVFREVGRFEMGVASGGAAPAGLWPCLKDGGE